MKFSVFLSLENIICSFCSHTETSWVHLALGSMVQLSDQQRRKEAASPGSLQMTPEKCRNHVVNSHTLCGSYPEPCN